MLNKEFNTGEWKIVKIFSLIPRKCYDGDTRKYFIVWLEYINRNYKYNEQKKNILFILIAQLTNFFFFFC